MNSVHFQCSIDVLNWFDNSPTAEETEQNLSIQACVTQYFNQKTDFLQNFKQKIAEQENKVKISSNPHNNGNGKRKKKIFILAAATVSSSCILVAAFLAYRHVMNTLKNNKFLEALEGKLKKKKIIKIISFLNTTI